MDDFSRYLAIPFKDKGRDFLGCDCWGLVRLFYKNELSMEIDDFASLYDNAHDSETIMKIAETERLKWNKITGLNKKGDVVEIPMTKRGYHVGVMATPHHVLHIEENGSARITPVNSRRINRRIKGIWRHNALS